MTKKYGTASFKGSSYKEETSILKNIVNEVMKKIAVPQLQLKFLSHIFAAITFS